MSALAIFSFENSQVRTLGTPENPLFVAIDIAVALGYANPKSAPAKIVDAEDLSKQEIETKGGRQTVNCVNESGLYALIFGSKLESAKRFKRWVTNEVLPAIRKQGRYECPIATLTPAQQLAIRDEVAKCAKAVSAKYQTIYRAMYAHFKVPRYTEILARDFDAAIEFIRTFNPRLPEVTQSEPPEDVAEWVRIRLDVVQQLQRFVYEMRYQHRDVFKVIHRMLSQLNSPYAGEFYESYTSLNFVLLERSLANLGFPVTDLFDLRRTPRPNAVIAR